MKTLKRIITAITLNIFVGVLKVIYLLLKILPAGQKIVFISRQSNKCTKDFEMLIEQFKHELQEYELVVLIKRMDYRFSYFLHLIRQMYHMATAKVCIIDSYIIPISVLKHKNTLKVAQIWHSMGAIKQFGHQSIGKSAGRGSLTSSILKMHNNYNLIFSGSKAMIKYYSKAFNYDESHFLVNNLPRMDYIINNRDNNTIKRKISSAYPGIFEKKIILYAPTFRGNDTNAIEDLIDKIDFDKFNLIIKLHPNEKQKSFDQRVFLCREFDAIELMLASECLITDYSGISIEASGSGIPVYLYLYDYNEYIKSTGLNIDLVNDYPGMVFVKAEEILKNLSSGNYDHSEIKKFNKKFVSSDDNNATELMVSKIISEFNLR